MLLDHADCSVADSRRPLTRAHSGKGGAVPAGALESDPRLRFSNCPSKRLDSQLSAPSLAGRVQVRQHETSAKQLRRRPQQPGLLCFWLALAIGPGTLQLTARLF